MAGVETVLNLKNAAGLPGGLDVGEERLQQYRERLMLDLGHVLWNALNDVSIGEIYVNGNGYVIFERLGVEGHEAHPRRMTAEEREKLAIAVLSIHNIPENAGRLYDVELPFIGARMSITGPPTAIGGWEFTIRKRIMVRKTFEQHVASGMMSLAEADALKLAIFPWGTPEGMYPNEQVPADVKPKTVVVAGGTGSGKTVMLQTFVDYLVACVTPKLREALILIEHVSELELAYPNCKRWRTDYGTTMLDLTHHALRNKPNRILAGELRDGSTLDYLKGISTGHPGALFTVHANSAQHGCARLCDLVEENSKNIKSEPIVNEAVDIVVFVQKRPDGSRYCPSIVKVDGLGPETRSFKTSPLVRRTIAA